MMDLRDTHHAACIRRWHTGYHCPPNVEELASTSSSVCTSAIALAGACVNIVLVEECVTHVLSGACEQSSLGTLFERGTYTGSTGCTVCWAERQLISTRDFGFNELLGSPPTAMLDVRWRSSGRVHLLSPVIGLFDCCVNITVKGTLEIGAFFVYDLVVELVVQVDEDCDRQSRRTRISRSRTTYHIWARKSSGQGKPQRCRWHC